MKTNPQKTVEEFLKPDPVWNVLGITSPEQMLESMPDLRLSQNVSEDIVKEYEHIEKLIFFSFYNYSFYHEAARRLIFTYEMALQIRYLELENKEWKGTLKKLIEKLHGLGCFDTSIEELQWVREARNHIAHTKRHEDGGIAMTHWFQKITVIINEVFEDLNIKNCRRAKLEEYRENIKKFNGKCFGLKDGESFALLYFLDLILVESRESTDKVTFIGLAISQLEQLSEEQMPWPIIISFQLTNIKLDFEKQLVIGQEVNTGKNIVLQAFTDSEPVEIIENWWEEVEKRQNKQILNTMIHGELNNYYLTAKQEFLVNQS